MQNKKGFSLIEGVVAIFVLSVGVMAVVQLFARTSVQARENGKYLTATALAQEGVELVRVVRNDNIVKGESDIFSGITLPRGMVSSANPVSISRYGIVSDAKLAVPSGAVPKKYQHNVSSVDTTYPFFWRVVYSEVVTGSGGAAKNIASVVYFREPSAFPVDISAIESNCTLRQGCVFLKTTLQ